MVHLFQIISARIQAWILAVIILVQGMFSWVDYPSMSYTNDMGEIIKAFNEPNGRIMSMAHRGDWKNYPENSMPAIQSCIDMGVDIVEIDLHRTSDGVIVISHDDSIDRMTTGKGKIAGMTFSEISKYYLKEGEGGWSQSKTSYRMPSLVEALKTFGGRIMFYLDDAMPYKDEVRDLLEKYNCLDSCFLVDSTPYVEISTWFRQLEAAGKALPVFGCKIKNADETATTAYLNSFLAGGLCPIAEISFDNDDRATAKPETYTLARTGMRTIGTTLGGEQCASRKDDETGWAYLIKLGDNVMQTDHIQELMLYKKAVNSVRQAEVRTQAEHFNDFTSIALTDADMHLNKYATRLKSGSYLEYKNIKFDGTETQIAINACCMLGAKIEVLIDGVSAGTVTVSGNVVFKNYTAKINATAGVHTVRLSFTKVNGSVAAVDYFVFLS